VKERPYYFNVKAAHSLEQPRLLREAHRQDLVGRLRVNLAQLTQEGAPAAQQERAPVALHAHSGPALSDPLVEGDRQARARADGAPRSLRKDFQNRM
jgi:hypothetical protein